mgnify:FL=1
MGFLNYCELSGCSEGKQIEYINSEVTQDFHMMIGNMSDRHFMNVATSEVQNLLSNFNYMVIRAATFIGSQMTKTSLFIKIEYFSKKYT